MELKYLMARWHEKLIFFIVSTEEAETLSQKINSENDQSHVFTARKWVEDSSSKHKLERYLSRADRVVVTSKPIDSQMIGELVCEAHVSGTMVMDLNAFLSEIEPLVHASSHQLIHHLSAAHGGYKGLKVYDFIKFALEPLVALCMFIVLLPLILIVAIMVKLTSEGPVIYSQDRVGFHGRIFKLYKFRSMRVNAEGGKPVWASAATTDSFLTPIGKFLRAKHLDELPQLWNIILGDLSFIGPRPERPEFVNELTQLFPFFKLRPLIKPGLTGWAQVKLGYANTVNDSLRKLEFDLFYIINHSPKLDAVILFKTILILFSGGTEGLKHTRTKTMKVPT